MRFLRRAWGGGGGRARAERGEIEGRRRDGRIMRRDLALDLRDMDERPVPARFKLARYQPVCGVGGIILAEGAIGRVARRFEIATERLAPLIPPFSGFLGGSIRSRDGAWTDDTNQRFLDRIVGAQSAEGDALGAPVVHPGRAAGAARNMLLT